MGRISRLRQGPVAGTGRREANGTGVSAGKNDGVTGEELALLAGEGDCSGPVALPRRSIAAERFPKNG